MSNKSASYRRAFVEGLEWPDSITLGEIPGVRYLHKFGHNPGITTTDETVWCGGTLYTGWLAAAETVTILSDNALDDAASTGTGAKTVTIYGLDANYDEISETLTMDGDTGSGAQSTQEFLRVFNAIVETVGSYGTNVGNLTITTDTGSVDVAVILADAGVAEMCLWTVPRNYKAYIKHVSCALGKGEDGTFKGMIHPSSGAWQVRWMTKVFQEHLDEHFDPMLGPFDEKTDIELRVKADNVGTIATGDFMIIYVEKEVSNVELN